MSEKIRFVRNYSDLSTNQGFQFEFFCDRCGTGYRTKFQQTVSGAVSGLLDAAGGIFGGVFGRASNIGGHVRSATWERDHDSAFEKAIEEITPDFIQCPHCSVWVCRSACWSEQKGLCKECSPDLGVEMAAAQAAKSKQEIWAHAAMAEEDKKLGREVWRQGIRATCPKCNVPLAQNVKFCPECGERLQAQHCTSCGAKIQPSAKFCGECGQKTG